LDRTVEVLGVVVEDADVVEDPADLRSHGPAADPVGEEGDELFMFGRVAEAAREPVLAQRASRQRHDVSTTEKVV
jgi:hypothetical protein